MDESYAEVGAEVILGKHTRDPVGCGINWNPYKDKYVGKKTVITKVRSRDLSGCLVCSVQCDNESWAWRVENMILASDVPLLTQEQRAKLRIQDG